MAAPRRAASKLTAPKLAAARKRTGREPVAEAPSAREGPPRPAAQPGPAQGKTQVWIPGAPLPGTAAGPRAAPAPATTPAPATGRDASAPLDAPVTGNTLRGAFGGAVAAAFAETFGDSPPGGASGAAGPSSDDAGTAADGGPDMNTVVEVGPPASLRASSSAGATQPGPKPAPVRQGKTQIWLGGSLPPSSGARPVASAGGTPTPGHEAGAGPLPASFQTDVAFPDAAAARPPSRDPGPEAGQAPVASSASEPDASMKTTVGLPPAGQSLAAAAEAARAAAAAEASLSSPPPPVVAGRPAAPAPPPTGPTRPPVSDFRQAAEQGFTRQGRDAPRSGGAPVWVWVAGGVVVVAVLLALVLK